MNRQQLAAKIWASANKMRSKIEAHEYKDYILGFIFYKFLSDREEERLLKEEWTKEDLAKELKEEDKETVKYCQENLGYFISYDNLFSTWLTKGKDFGVSNVNDALNAFSRLINPTHQAVFGGKKKEQEIFYALQNGLAKLGDSTGAQTKAISDLINLINDIPMDGRQGYDVLGFIYEYLISMFAANAGKKAGEFYTPNEVSLLMSEIVANHLKDRKEIQIYDPTSGSGSLLINIGKSVGKHMSEKDKIKYYAQELKENTYNLTRMNLVMRGILTSNIVTRNADTLENDWPYFDESDPSRYEPLYVDAVVSNPPYSQHWDNTDKDGDVRYKGYGIAPESKADYAFLLHDLFHVKPDGIMTIVLPHGVLFRGGEEEKIRRNLIKENKIDTIIGLPANIFFGTGIPTIIMVLKKQRDKDNSDVLIIDASKGFVKDGKNSKLRASDIKKIVDTISARKDVDKYAKVVSRKEIENNDYNLNIPRYVDSADSAEKWDIYATMFGGIPNSEIDELSRYWLAFPSLKEHIFRNDGTPYSALISDDINSIVNSSEDFKGFKDEFNKSFFDLGSFLNNELVSKIDEIDRSKEEQIISDDMFKRLETIPLIDRYQAYQVLDDYWKQIEIDLEIIQTEGKSSIKKVDPFYVLKKKDGKDAEVQDGWEGRIIPFAIVQNTILTDETNILKSKEKRLSEITDTYQEIIDSLSEEDKGNNFLNKDNTSFVSKEVNKYIKDNIKKGMEYADDSLESKIVSISNMLKEEKDLKKEAKDLSVKLDDHTKKTIEDLSTEQANMLLNLKWIDPIVTSLSALPEIIVSDFASKIKNLVGKYSMTFLDVEKQIKDSTANLTGLIDELEGNEFDMKGLEELKNVLNGN